MKEINRREFIKVSTAAGAALMTGSVLPGQGSNAYGAVKIPEVEKLTISVITDNYYDCLGTPDRIARRTNWLTPGITLHTEHGLGYYIETEMNGKTGTFMFDFGWDFEGVGKNIKIMNLDLRKLDALGLSHGHLDHCGGLLPMLTAYKDKIKKGIPLYVGQEAFAHRFIKLPAIYTPMDGLNDLGQLNREELDKSGMVSIKEINETTPIVPGAYLTGDIERVTDYEKGSPLLFIKRGEQLENDLFQGEQSLIFNVKGKGLVLVSSCAHAGIINTVHQARKISGVEKLHAVIGGFHLTGAPAEKIQKTVADMKAINPEYIVPMHCTGWQAIMAFQREMPQQFVLNMAGTRYIFHS